MKRVFAGILSCALLLGSTGCGAQVPQISEPTAVTEAAAPVFTDEVKAKLDAVLVQRKFKGIVSLVHKGEPVYQSVSGSNDLGEPLTIDSPMFIGSVSKQFCAAAVLMLRDQGKLSLEDTLDKYFPEYTLGRSITLKHLLTMRSGIVRDVDPMFQHPEEYENNTWEENEALFKEWVFAQPLDFEPDTNWEYSNINYILLSFIVEIASGENYEDFVTQNIFEPLGMTHSGFHWGVRENAPWTQGLTYDKLIATPQVPIMAQGAGGIISTAGDMDKWMTALQNGRVICQESYREMITDHSPEIDNYGYGLSGAIRNGIAHNGGNGGYGSYMYFHEEYGLQLFIATNEVTMYSRELVDWTARDLLGSVFTALDEAADQ